MVGCIDYEKPTDSKDSKMGRNAGLRPNAYGNSLSIPSSLFCALDLLLSRLEAKCLGTRAWQSPCHREATAVKLFRGTQ